MVKNYAFAYPAGAIFNFQIMLIDPMVKNYAFACPAGSRFGRLSAEDLCNRLSGGESLLLLA